MHEFSMCESLLETMEAEYRRFLDEKRPARPPRVTRVLLVLGELHQIVPESLLLAYETLSRDTPFAGSRLALEHVPVRIRCRACAWEGEIKAPDFLCQRCGGGEVEITAGRELYIKEMELEDDEPENL